MLRYRQVERLRTEFKLVATIGGGIKRVLGVEASGEAERANISDMTFRRLEIDPGDPNDLVNAFVEAGFSKFVVLEDFHYLPKETQENFSFFLKTIHERSKICFVIVAVWREENRLIVLNGDLSGRVLSVDADAWTDSELLEVIASGEALLNVSFSDEFKSELIKKSLGSVYIVQEACRRACSEVGLRKTTRDHLSLSTARAAGNYVADVVNESGARYVAFLTSFAGGFQDTQLEMYRWLLHPILTSSIEDLEKGIKYRYIRETLERVHPKKRDLNPGNVTQALLSVPALQSRKNIKPFVLDYDQSNLKLSVVDRGFLIWLSTQNVDELLDQLEITP